jgi:hypothetical protein
VSDLQPTQAAADEQQDVLEIVRTSRAFERLAATLSIVPRAAETSASMALIRSAHARWSNASPQHRMRTIGVMLLGAALVHIVINSAFGDIAGRFWLAIPLAAALAGTVMLFASFRRQAREHPV